MAEIPAPARRPLRFGIFALNPHSGELRKAGVLVGLQEQSLKVLVELLERPGELVTREQLRQRLWPDGTFVDFDHGLNAVINRLRETLGDSADSPRFIETVPRRGYRFIAPVDDGGTARVAVSPPTRSLKSRTRRWMVGAAGIALALSAVALLARLWSSPRASMRTIPLTALPGTEHHPMFSPDGRQVAFVWDGGKAGNEDIYVKVIGTDVPLRLTSNPAAEGYPAWSSDGRHIAFARASGDRSDLLVIPALGGPERKIHARSCSMASCRSGLSWSPDRQLVAFADREESEVLTSSIFLLSLNTLKKRKLTSPPEGANGDFTPAFSPDGRTIAFNRIAQVSGGIYVVPAAGGDPKRVTQEQYFWLGGLAWLPTGRELLFSYSGSDPQSSSNLWRVSASGGTPELLGVGGNNAANPDVSQQGDRLAYEQRLEDANIWKIALPQSTRPDPAPSPLIASSWHESGPQVSPDGKRIAFHSDRSGNLEIWMCDPAGANLVQLTSFGDSLSGTPRWSPDSRQLAFEARVKGHPGLYVINVDGDVPRKVMIEQSGLPVLASWSSDGRWIYFGSNNTGRFEIWKVRAEGGGAVQVTKRGGFAAFESADGKFVYYVKAGQGGLWKVLVNGGEETAVLDHPKAHLWGYWALVNDGIYFVDELGPRPALQFFSFRTTRVVQVLALDGKPIAHNPGLAISPDGRWLLYTQVDHRSGDIMLVENFH